jgi:hypothetical protein
MAGRIPWGGRGLKEVKLTITTMMVVAAALATVGQRNKEWGGDNALMAMIPLTMIKMTRTTTKKEGGWAPPPPGFDAQGDWRRTATDGYRQ